MRMSGRTAPNSKGNLLLVFASAVACLFVAGRLWQYSRAIAHLEREIQQAEEVERVIITKLLAFNRKSDNGSNSCDGNGSGAPEFVTKVKRDYTPVVPGLSGPRIKDELVLTVTADGEGKEPPLLGQLDGVADGYVNGWACQRGVISQGLKVVLYINDVQIGEVVANKPAPHSIVNRLCEGLLSFDTGLQSAINPAFRFKLPELPDGYYQIRAFAYHPENKWRKELHMSPLDFIESSVHPDLHETIRRKDDIIRGRNAEVALLYKVLNTRGAWETVTEEPRWVNSQKDQEDQDIDGHLLAFIGVMSDPDGIDHRTYLRKTWMGNLPRMEEKGVRARFILGTSGRTEAELAALDKENKTFGDILIIDNRSYESPGRTMLAFYRSLALTIEADFFFKVAKDVMVNVDNLVSFLTPKRRQGNMVLGCMKSGEVIRDANARWYEPQHSRFGDPVGKEMKLSYPRHPHGQAFGLSGLVAKYLGRNAAIFHGFQHDDVTLGTWLLGLDVDFVDENKFCCQGGSCAPNTKAAKTCLSYFDTACPGVCDPQVNLASIYRDCVSPEVKHR